MDAEHSRLVWWQQRLRKSRHLTEAGDTRVIRWRHVVCNDIAALKSDMAISIRYALKITKLSVHGLNK